MQIHSTKPVTPEQAEVFLSTLAKRSADKFTDALSSGPPFQDVARGKMFGIVINDTDNDGIGDLIYQVWMGIFRRKMRQGSNLLRVDLMQALVTAQLAPTFQRWMEEVITEEEDDRNASSACKQLKERNLDFSLVIHPTDAAHREHMERFRDKKL